MRRRGVRVAFMVLALLLAMGCGAVTAVNPWRLFTVIHAGPRSFRSLALEAGSVQYGCADVANQPGEQGWFAYAHGPRGPRDPEFEPFFWWPRYVSKPGNFIVIIPLWMIALPSLAAAVWIGRGLGRRAGQCPCGYDLAGLPAGAKCPECGRSAAASRSGETP